MRYTIQDLRDGKCAVKNDSDTVQLRKVLNVAFSKDKSPIGDGLYYVASEVKGRWQELMSTRLPSQACEDFFKSIPNFGDKILVSNGDDWSTQIYVGYMEGSLTPWVTVDPLTKNAFDKGNSFSCVCWRDGETNLFN